jgi:hypothetical protein
MRMSKQLTGIGARRSNGGPSLFRTRSRVWRLVTFAAVAILAAALVVVLPKPPAAHAACANPVACENQLPGTPPSVWDMTSGEGTTIQGFADPFSVNVGSSINFKIESPASGYTVDIYRMGYYGGDGARLVASVTPNIAVSQSQPACNTNTTTGLVDCGNWGVSASWNVPATAVSGVYFAHIERTDKTDDENQIPFVVTNNASHSDVVFMTSDETWQAYNDWGGYSLYTGDSTGKPWATSALDPGRAVQVSYNRPFATRFDTPGGQDYFFANEYPMIRFMEKNGYDVSYVSQEDVGASTGASMLEQHKTFMNVGHSEYWDAADRANVTAARNAGVNLAFFAGNLMWWKTRLAASQFGNEANRTLITYKESLDSAQTDPSDPPTWTGEWRDPRFSPPADGGQPENALTGQLWTVNCCSYAMQVPAAYSKLRLWRNTSVASLAAGQTATFSAETLGYEWDSDVDNGFRPAGEIDMSKTTEAASQVVLDPQEDIGPETETNSLTLYRAASGALVFDTGTVQWAWGLDSTHDGDATPISLPMQQATVNLLADMGAQPATLSTAGVVAATASTDHTAPTSTMSSPAAGATINNGSTVTVSGTATDAGGGVVAGVEVSTDSGSTWHPVTTMSSAATSVTWSYTWSAAGSGPVTVESRATDDSGNIETPHGVNVTVNCPCGLFGANYVPSVTSADDASANELGVKFQSSVPGWVAGVRFYKGSGNVGTHTGSLWTSTGTQLATGTFTNETASGWQTLLFANPVQITANTTYVVSYYAPDGHYADESDLFDWPRTTPPLTAPKSAYAGTGGGNGVYNDGGPGFPTASFQGTSYGVDVVFDSTQPAGAAPTVSSVTPTSGSTNVPISTTPTATFSAAVVPSTLSFTLANSSGTAVPGTVSFNSTDTVATFKPTSSLAASTAYTATVSGAQNSLGQKITPVTYTFTTGTATAGQCPCTIWPSTAPPAGSSDAADTSAVELGVQFQAATSGTISGVRFYKETDNTGTHTGTLWSASGAVLATGTFTSESASGWQELDFTTPVAVTAGTTYVASYHTSTGHYALTQNALGTAVTNGPLTVPANGGVYAYGGTSTFPSSTFSGSNYWVDVVYNNSTSGPVAPAVTTTSPSASQTGVSTGSSVSFTFNEAVQQATIGFALTGSGGASVPGSLAYNSSTNTATFAPTSALSAGTSYTATVSAAQSASGTPMSGPHAWSFTTAAAPAPCPCSIFTGSALPTTITASDTSAVNLGVRFTSDSSGWITGIRFYKGANNTGTHLGSLWNASGTLLGQVTFTGESASGWQQANFATPIAVTANTTYIASYFAPKGDYSYTSQAFASAAVNSPPLHALQSGTAGNGIYTYASASAFPTSTFNATNYFVDVVFSTTAP